MQLPPGTSGQDVWLLLVWSAVKAGSHQAAPSGLPVWMEPAAGNPILSGCSLPALGHVVGSLPILSLAQTAFQN